MPQSFIGIINSRLIKTARALLFSGLRCLFCHVRLQATKPKKCKLALTPEVAHQLKATLREFAKGYNLIAEIGFGHKLHRRYDLHHATYRQARGQTSLPSEHVINAIAKVSEAFIRERNKRHKFKPLSSVRYDSRTLTFKRDFREATLTVCPMGRVSGELQMPAAMPGGCAAGSTASQPEGSPSRASAIRSSRSASSRSPSACPS